MLKRKKQMLEDGLKIVIPFLALILFVANLDLFVEVFLIALLLAVLGIILEWLAGGDETKENPEEDEEGG